MEGVKYYGDEIPCPNYSICGSRDEIGTYKKNHDVCVDCGKLFGGPLVKMPDRSCMHCNAYGTLYYLKLCGHGFCAKCLREQLGIGCPEIITHELVDAENQEYESPMKDTEFFITGLLQDYAHRCRCCRVKWKTPWEKGLHKLPITQEN